MDKIDKDSNYISQVNERSEEGLEYLLKRIVDKINEIIDWINTQ